MQKNANAFTFSDFVFMHSADVVKSSNRSSYEYWMKREPGIVVDDLLKANNASLSMMGDGLERKYAAVRIIRQGLRYQLDHTVFAKGA